MSDKAISQPGIYRISEDVYHSDPCKVPSVSRGVICNLINSTPAHAKFYHPQLNPDYVSEEKKTFDMGTAAHSLFLEGIDCCTVIDAPDWRSKDAKTAREEAYLSGKTPLLKHQHSDVVQMVSAAYAQLQASEIGIKDLLAEGDSELTYIWQEDETFCRVRPDWISHKQIGGRKLILDYKTVGESADPNAFIRKVFSMGYDIQHSFYRQGVKAIEGGDSPRFLFMVQENFAPYLCSFIGLDSMTIQIASEKVKYGLSVWNQCMESGEWPAYPKRVCYVETPSWALAQWEQKSLLVGTE